MKSLNIFLIFQLITGLLAGQPHHDKILWEKGSGPYNNYRIPSLIVTLKGTLLAFCEGREAGDSGNIDLLLRRSENNGKTWSEMQVVWNDGDNTCGNPCPVVDAKTGRIWLFMTWNDGRDNEKSIIGKKSLYSRKPFMCWSDDDGKSWSEPADMSATCKDTTWEWYATGPGIGIQLRNDPFKGRLVIPADHSYNDPEANAGIRPYGYGSHVLFSDDGGKNWQISNPVRPGCNESQVTELTDGTLLLNMRSYNNKQCRAVSYSHDGGKNWSPVTHDLQLVEPVCQAGLLNFGKYRGKTVYLFSNPAVPFGRTQLTLKASLDDCQTWLESKLIWTGPSAYSCLTRLPDGHIGILFEAGEKSPYESLRFICISPREIIGLH